MITLRIDGAEVSARDGQTIAAAMLATGRLAWRTTARQHRPRGVFCG
ncbi:MAG TPA: 2Fe-2S iron-sulfur cluster-binding protein, partial [Microlunatus sp.]